jgi:hypothetical protein
VPCQPRVAYCLSYVPLLRGEPGVDIAEDVRRRPERLRQILSCTVSGFGDACLWLVRGGSPFPALVYDRGDEIHAHLLEWDADDPPAWFNLYLAELPQGDDPVGSNYSA